MHLDLLGLVLGNSLLQRGEVMLSKGALIFCHLGGMLKKMTTLKAIEVLLFI